MKIWKFIYPHDGSNDFTNDFTGTIWKQLNVRGKGECIGPKGSKHFGKILSWGFVPTWFEEVTKEQNFNSLYEKLSSRN